MNGKSFRKSTKDRAKLVKDRPSWYSPSLLNKDESCFHALALIFLSLYDTKEVFRKQGNSLTRSMKTSLSNSLGELVSALQH